MNRSSYRSTDAHQDAFSNFDLPTKEDFEAWLDDHGLEVEDAMGTIGPDKNDSIRYGLKSCPFNGEHTGNCAWVKFRGDGRISAGCWKPDSKGKGFADLRDIVDVGWRIRAREAGFTAIHDSRSLMDREAMSRALLAPKAVPLWGFEKPAPLRSVVDNLLFEGYGTILAADGGTGKSYLAMYLATRVIRELPFFGHKTIHGRVLYVDFELDENEQKRRLSRVLAGEGMSPHDEALIGRFFYYRPEHPLSSDACHDEVIALIREHDISLVILDSLTIALGADATRQEDVTRIMQRFREWGTVLAIDHISAQAARGNQSQARPFGSVMKRNIVRNTLVLSRADGGGYILTPDKSNFGPKQDMMCYDLEFDQEKDSVVFRSIEITDDAMAGAVKNMPTRDITLKAIEEIYRECNLPVSLEEIEAWRNEQDAPISIGVIRNHATVLKKEGKIEFQGNSTYLPVNRDKRRDGMLKIGDVEIRSPFSLAEDADEEQGTDAP